jgi:hypothetical protein
MLHYKWDITPCNSVKVDWRFGRTYCLLQSQRMSQDKTSKKQATSRYSCLVCFSTLKMEAISSSKTLVNFDHITRHYIPEDRTPRNHRCENFNSDSLCYIQSTSSGSGTPTRVVVVTCRTHVLWNRLWLSCESTWLPPRLLEFNSRKCICDS